MAPFASATAQETTALGSAPEIEIPFEFTRVTGVYELADGRIVVDGGGDAAILVADFERRLASPLGRHGSGPGEYRVPMFLYPLGGDSLGVPDDAASRLLVVTRDGRPGGFLSLRTGDARRGSAAAARFGDGRGFFYGEGPSIGVARDGSAQVVDSAPILRWRVGAGSPAVLTYIHRPALAGARVEGGSLAVLPAGTQRPALSSRSLWAVARDGRIAAVDPEPYRVTLVSPSGERIATSLIPHARVPVTDSVSERTSRIVPAVKRSYSIEDQVPSRPFAAAAPDLHHHHGSTWFRRSAPMRSPHSTAWEPLDPANDLRP